MIEYVDYLIEQNKLEKLKILWNFCLKLGENDRQLLEIRLQEIIRDVVKYLKGEEENLSEILNFIAKFTNIIQICFDSNKTINNILYNTIEEVLTENEKVYNELLSKRIFKPSEAYNQEILYKLFKLLPNK